MFCSKIPKKKGLFKQKPKTKTYEAMSSQKSPVKNKKTLYLNKKFSKLFKSNLNCTKCSICLEEKKSEKIILKCGHSFHKKCIHKWFKTDSLNLSCPLCRRKNSSVFNKDISIIDNIKNYKIYINNFKNKNVDLILSNKTKLNINIKNIINLIDYNQAYNLIIPFKNKEMGQINLFEVNEIKITHFLRNIILFGKDEQVINVIEKQTTDNQKYITVNEEQYLDNYNKTIFNNLYNYSMQILKTLEKNNMLNINIKNKCLFWDLCFNLQITTNKSFIEIFKLFVIILIQMNTTYNIESIEKIYTSTINTICNYNFNIKFDLKLYSNLKDNIKYILNNSEKLNFLYFK